MPFVKDLVLKSVAVGIWSLMNFVFWDYFRFSMAKLRVCFQTSKFCIYNSYCFLMWWFWIKKLYIFMELVY